MPPRPAGRAALQRIAHRWGRGQHSVTAHAPERGAGHSQPLCTRPTAAILNCRAVCRHTAPSAHGPELQCWLQRSFLSRNSAWKCHVEASVSGSLWEGKAQWSTKEKEKRLDFISLPKFYFYFLGIVNGLCWWANDFPERLCQFIFLASSPGFFSPHCFFILAIPIGVTWYLIVILMFIYLIVILMFIFLIATNVEHLFTCLLVTHISSLVKCLFMSFSHFLTGFFLKFSF